MWLKQHLALRSLALAMKRAREAAEADLDELDAWCKMEIADDYRAAAVRLQAPTTPTGSPPPRRVLVPGVRTMVYGSQSSGRSAATAIKSEAAAAPQPKLVRTSKASQLPAAKPKPTSAAMAANPKPTSCPQAYLKEEVKDEDEKLKDEVKSEEEKDEQLVSTPSADYRRLMEVEEPAAAPPARAKPPWRMKAPAYSPIPPPTCAAPAQVEPQPLGAPPPPPLGAPPPPPTRAPPPGPPPPDPVRGAPPAPPSQGPPPPHNFIHGPPPLPPPPAPDHAEPRAKGRFPGERGGAFAKYFTARHHASRLGSRHLAFWEVGNPRPKNAAEARVFREASI